MNTTNAAPASQTAASSGMEIIKPPSKTFIAKAEKAEAKIIEQVKVMEICYVTIGRMASDFAEEGYHRGRIDPSTGTFYTEFDKWAATIFGKSKGVLYANMRVVNQLKGKVADDDLKDMTRSNAEVLVDLASDLKKGTEEEIASVITSELVEKAKTLPKREFEPLVQAIRNDLHAAAVTRAEAAGKTAPAPAPPRPALIRPVMPMLTLEENEFFERTMDMAREQAGDDDRERPLNVKALMNICGSFQVEHATAFYAAHPEVEPIGPPTVVASAGGIGDAEEHPPEPEEQRAAS